MDHRQRAQSVLQIHPQSLPSRASRFLQKVSHLRILLPLSSWKGRDDRDLNDPYSARTRSMEGIKPYMSQPLLANVRPESCSAEGDDSYSQNSPSVSERRRASGETPLHEPRLRPAMDDSRAVVPEAKPTGIDGLPAGSAAHAPPLFSFMFNQHPASDGESPAAPTIVVTNPSESSEGQSAAPPQSINEKPSRSAIPTSESAALSSAKRLVRRISRKRLKSNTSDSDRPTPNAPESPSSAPSTVPSRPAMHSCETSPPTSRPTEVQHKTYPFTRRSTDPPPRLTLPNYSHRFSLTLSDGTAARFSPSIIMHAPPLPLNLPALPTIAPAGPPSDSAQVSAGLRNMPELPQTGPNPDDENDGDEEDLMGEDSEDENESEEEPDGSSSTLSRVNLDQSDPKASTSSIDESEFLRPGVDRPSSRNSRRSSVSSNQEGYFTPLPGPDTSRLDLSFINELLPPRSDPMGKGKVKGGEEDNEPRDELDVLRTPTLTFPYREGFNSQTRASRPGWTEEHEVGGSRAVPRRDSQGTSVRTPRAEDSEAHAGWLPAMPSRSSALISQFQFGGGDVLASLPTTPATRHSLYKHASRSMIDFHAIETRERVEQMIREGEQAATGEEKMRSNTKGKQRMSTVDGPETALLLGEGVVSLVDEVDHATPAVDMGAVGDGASRRLSRAPPYESLGHVLPMRRRRSMPVFTEATDPPPYPSFRRSTVQSGLPQDIMIQPRDDEGLERLPEYTNDVYIRAVIPRKMEFVSAGVQARDRKWRKVVCVLEGTALKIYRPASASGVLAIGAWWERKVGVGDVSGSYAAGAVQKQRESDRRVVQRAPKLDEIYLQEETLTQTDPPSCSLSGSTTPASSVHRPTTPSSTLSRFGLNLLRPSRSHGRSMSYVPALSVPRGQASRPSLNLPNSSASSMPRPSESGTSLGSASLPTASSGSTTGSSTRVKNSAASVEPSPRDLIRVYSMQNAESGLGSDYLKRKNVIRIRVEGEQFLLQAKDTADVVAWIEALQASANIALDLDDRPMPRGPLFPRRRRRRQRRTNATTTEPAASEAPPGDVERRATVDSRRESWRLSRRLTVILDPSVTLAAESFA